VVVGADDVLALGAELGLPPAAGRRVLRRAVDAVDTWLPLLDDLPYDVGRRRKLERVIVQRRRRLTP
jgi:cytochrome c-type biogenesis protein CcmH/NrfG